jgi:hypothetical protein
MTEAFNALNKTIFNDPNTTTPPNTAFGRITGAAAPGAHVPVCAEARILGRGYERST